MEKGNESGHLSIRAHVLIAMLHYICMLMHEVTCIIPMNEQASLADMDPWLQHWSTLLRLHPQHAATIVVSVLGSVAMGITIHIIKELTKWDVDTIIAVPAATPTPIMA